jgi:hypothetical protein
MFNEPFITTEHGITTVSLTTKTRHGWPTDRRGGEPGVSMIVEKLDQFGFIEIVLRRVIEIVLSSARNEIEPGSEIVFFRMP